MVSPKCCPAIINVPAITSAPTTLFSSKLSILPSSLQIISTLCSSSTNSIKPPTIPYKFFNVCSILICFGSLSGATTNILILFIYSFPFSLIAVCLS